MESHRHQQGEGLPQLRGVYSVDRAAAGGFNQQQHQFHSSAGAGRGLIGYSKPMLQPKKPWISWQQQCQQQQQIHQAKHSDQQQQQQSREQPQQQQFHQQQQQRRQEQVQPQRQQLHQQQHRHQHLEQPQHEQFAQEESAYQQPRCPSENPYGGKQQHSWLGMQQRSTEYPLQHQQVEEGRNISQGVERDESAWRGPLFLEMRSGSSVCRQHNTTHAKISLSASTSEQERTSCQHSTNNTHGNIFSASHSSVPYMYPACKSSLLEPSNCSLMDATACDNSTYASNLPQLKDFGRVTTADVDGKGRVTALQQPQGHMQQRQQQQQQQQNSGSLVQQEQLQRMQKLNGGSTKQQGCVFTGGGRHLQHTTHQHQYQEALQQQTPAVLQQQFVPRPGAPEFYLQQQQREQQHNQQQRGEQLQRQKQLEWYSSEGAQRPLENLFVPTSPAAKQKHKHMPAAIFEQQQESTTLPWESGTHRRQPESLLFLQHLKQHETLLQRKPQQQRQLQQQLQQLEQQQQQRRSQQQQHPLQYQPPQAKSQQQSQPQQQPQQPPQQQQQQGKLFARPGLNAQQQQGVLPIEDRDTPTQLQRDWHPPLEMAWQQQQQQWHHAAAVQQEQQAPCWGVEDPAALAEQLPPCTAFKQLSDEQRAVVFAPFHKDVCVIAGPGSGKTRVLAARVALLLLLQPAPVLALTFTRKGAEEMRQRIIAAVSSVGSAISAVSSKEESSPKSSFLSPHAGETPHEQSLEPRQSLSLPQPRLPAASTAAAATEEAGRAARAAHGAAAHAAPGTAASAAAGPAPGITSSGIAAGAAAAEGAAGEAGMHSFSVNRGEGMLPSNCRSLIAGNNGDADNAVSIPSSLSEEEIPALGSSGGTRNCTTQQQARMMLSQELLSPIQQQKLLLSLKTGRISVCTFHKFCLQFLRQHASKHLHIDTNFRIATPSEQVRLARDIILRFKQRLQVYTTTTGRNSSVSGGGAFPHSAVSVHRPAAPTLSSVANSSSISDTLHPLVASSSAAVMLAGAPIPAAGAISLSSAVGLPTAASTSAAAGAMSVGWNDARRGGDPAAAELLLQNKNLEVALNRARASMRPFPEKRRIAVILQNQKQQQQQQRVSRQQQVLQRQQKQIFQQQQRLHGISSMDEEEGEMSGWDSEEESEDSEQENAFGAVAGEAARPPCRAARGTVAVKRDGQNVPDKSNSTREKDSWKEAEELLKLVRKCKRRGCMAVLPGRRCLERSRSKQQTPENISGEGAGRGSSPWCYSAAAEEWWQQLQQENWPAALLVEEYHNLLLSRKPPLLDQSDLIRCTLLLLDWNSKVSQLAAKRYPFILVDEFQDTSREQLRILQLLRPGANARHLASSSLSPTSSALSIQSQHITERGTAPGGKHQQQQQGGIMVVGDDDQSIYSFRGIDAKNFTLFQQAYPHAIELHLSQNFRCCSSIVSASAALISHNTRRRVKQLRAATEEHSIALHAAAAAALSSLAADPSSATAAAKTSSLPLPLTNAGSDKKEGLTLTTAPRTLPSVLCAFLSSPRAEAQYILRYILAVKQHRRLCWRDFAILSRTNRALKEIEALLTDPTVLRAACFTEPLPYYSALPMSPLSAAVCSTTDAAAVSFTSGGASAVSSATGAAGVSFTTNAAVVSSATSAAAVLTTVGAEQNKVSTAAGQTAVLTGNVSLERKTGVDYCAAIADVVSSTTDTAAAPPLASSYITGPASLGAASAAAASRPSTAAVAAARGQQHRQQQSREYWYAADKPPDPALLLENRWSLLTFPEDIPLRSTAATKLLCGQQLLRRTDTLQCLVHLRLAIDLDHDWSFVKVLQLKGLRGVGPGVLKKLDELRAADVTSENQCKRGGRYIFRRKGEGRGRKKVSAAADEEEDPSVLAQHERGSPFGDGLPQLQLNRQGYDGGDATVDRGPQSLFDCLCCLVNGGAAINHHTSNNRNTERGEIHEKHKKCESGLTADVTKGSDALAPAGRDAERDGGTATQIQQLQQGMLESRQQENRECKKASSISRSRGRKQLSKHVLEQLQRVHSELLRLHALTKFQVSAADVLRFILVDLGVEAQIARGKANSELKGSAQSESKGKTESHSVSSKSGHLNNSVNKESSSVIPNSSDTMPNSGSNTVNSSSSIQKSSSSSVQEDSEAIHNHENGCSVSLRARKRRRECEFADEKEADAAAVGSAALHHKLEHVWSLLRSAEAYKPTAAEPLGWHCVKRFLLDVGNDFCNGASALQEQHATRDAIILSTIHQAKGLEWPVVILCRAHEG